MALPFAATTLLAQERSSAFSGLIVRMNEPRNLEFPVSELREAIIPNEQFFVRSHFAVPTVDVKNWRLTVEGAVETPLELTYDELRKLPTSEATITIECAGNGRVALTPAVPGLQWGQGAVGNAVWQGVPLAALLKKAGVQKGAKEVIFEGADKGQVNADPKSPGPIHFARSIPLEKAQQPEVLLAHTMNGETLPVSHGYPVRAVVGGWYGMAAVKWVTRIIVSKEPFQGFWQSLDYSYFVRKDGLPTMVPLTTMQPKAFIARPGLNEVLPAGKPFRFFGAAWAGEQPVKSVELSLDGGKTWLPTKLLSEPKAMQWVLWEHSWAAPVRGAYNVVARATDASGATQPLTRDPDRRSYMINHLVPMEITVR